MGGQPASIFRLGEVASTMDVARERLAAGEPAPFWLVAECQSGGRGRHGRQWSSPPGNLYATLALTQPCLPAVAPQLGFVAGLALHQAVSTVAGLTHPRLAIKWPNDLLLDGAKLAGLLLEGVTLSGRFHVLIGFGVNVAHAPVATPYGATSLAQRVPMTAQVPSTRVPTTPMPTTPVPTTLERLADELAREWMRAEVLWRAGFAAIREAWLQRAALLGESIKVRLPDGERQGMMRGIDASGRLVLETAQGIVTIDAGDVFPL